MINSKYQRNELSFHNHEDAMKVAQILIKEHYVILLSREEDLIILNWEYSHLSNRNDVVFMSVDEFDEDYVELVHEEENESR